MLYVWWKQKEWESEKLVRFVSFLCPVCLLLAAGWFVLLKFLRSTEGVCAGVSGWVLFLNFFSFFFFNYFIFFLLQKYFYICSLLFSLLSLLDTTLQIIQFNVAHNACTLLNWNWPTTVRPACWLSGRQAGIRQASFVCLFFCLYNLFRWNFEAGKRE